MTWLANHVLYDGYVGRDPEYYIPSDPKSKAKPYYHFDLIQSSSFFKVVVQVRCYPRDRDDPSSGIAGEIEKQGIKKGSYVRAVGRFMAGVRRPRCKKCGTQGTVAITVLAATMVFTDPARASLKHPEKHLTDVSSDKFTDPDAKPF